MDITFIHSKIWSKNLQRLDSGLKSMLPNFDNYINTRKKLLKIVII